MSMHEAICSTCGAINHGDAHICWRCLGEVRPAIEPANARSARTIT